MILAAMAHGPREKEEVLTEKAATDNLKQSYEYKVKEQAKEVSEVKRREAQGPPNMGDEGKAGILHVNMKMRTGIS